MTKQTDKKIKLISKTIEEWVGEFCETGDQLDVLMSRDKVLKSLYNKRNNMCYVLRTVETNNLINEGKVNENP